MGYIDIKIEVWQRLYFKEETDMHALAKEIEKGVSPNYLCERDDFESVETFYETETILELCDNDYASTVEVFDNENKKIWENGDKNI